MLMHFQKKLYTIINYELRESSSSSSSSRRKRKEEEEEEKGAKEI